LIETIDHAPRGHSAAIGRLRRVRAFKFIPLGAAV